MQPPEKREPAAPPQAPGAPDESTSPAPRLDVMSIEEIGAGRDMTAGSPEGWDVAPAEAAASASPGPPGPDSPEFELDDSPRPPEGESFRVKLDGFEGPLELLLHLVREHKLDINDIPIAFITDQYLKHIELMRRLNINIASDYLVMASWLVYIKSRTLLPQQEGDAQEEDPEVLRQELQRQLLEYQRFKRLSQAFRRAEEEQSWVFARGGNGDGIMLDPADAAEKPRLQVTMFDLISAIRHLIESIGEEGVHLVEIDELEMADRQTYLLDALEKAGPEGVVFQKLFEGARVLAVVVTFLALLELIRKNLVVARQSANFAEIRLAKAVKDD